MTVVDTYRVLRRQDMGEGNFREFGELIPEAHTWFAHEHWLHTGGLEEVEVDEGRLREAIAKYCPALGEQILELVGLKPGVYLEGAHASPRLAPLTQQLVTEGLNPDTAARVARVRRKQPTRTPRVKQGHNTIVATDIAPGIPTPSAEAPLAPVRPRKPRTTRTSTRRKS